MKKPGFVFCENNHESVFTRNIYKRFLTGVIIIAFLSPRVKYRSGHKYRDYVRLR